VTLIIERRFRGPANSGNGGYSCGLIATALIDGDAEVTLRVPPPLDTPLRVDGLDVYDGDTLVAEARPTTVELELPEPPDVVPDGRPDADHPFPGCFVCGPAREPGDGLRLLPVPIGGGRVAATWHVRDSSRELVWAALDCPGAFAVDPGFERGVSVLGRLAAHIEEVPAPGEDLIVVGWALPGGDERRSYAGTSLFRGKTPLAWARATWFSVGDSVRDPLPSAE
jgi:hypothetical protein